MAGARAHAALIVLCLILYLPGLVSLPPLDRDESRFAQASAQMLESGDYVDIRFQDTPRHKKPVAIYWLQAASVALFSDADAREIWAYRLPSLLGAMAAVLLTFSFGSQLVGRAPAFIGAALLAATLMTVSEAHQAKTDAVLLASIVAAQLVLCTHYARARGAVERAPPPIVFWLALGLGILVKGPIAPAVAILTAAALSAADRDARWLAALRPARGILVTLALVLPWGLAIGFATDWAFYADAIGGDVIPKLISGQESHGAPPGTHLALAMVTLWPASLFLWPGLANAWRARRRPEIRALLAWLAPMWIVFELAPTKLPHYTLPLFPALALMMGVGVETALAGGLRSAFKGWPARALAVVWAIIGLALAAAPIYATIRFGAGAPPLLIGLVAAAAITILAAAHAFWRMRITAALSRALIGAAVLYFAIVEIAMPSLDALAVSPRLVALAGADPRPLASVGYSEPSLVFLAGTDTRLASPGRAAQLLEEGTVGLVAVESRMAAKFRDAIAARGLTVAAQATIEGFNYSRGREVAITLYRLDPD